MNHQTPLKCYYSNNGPLITVIIVLLLLIITSSNDRSIFTYLRPAQLGDEFVEHRSKLF